MRADIFASEQGFKQAFRDGLHTILLQPDLGCFILVCANVFGDEELHRQMLPALERQFAVLKQSYMAGGLDKGDITATAEDRDIFQQIITQGLDTIPTVQYRQVGDWLCQFNQLRTFRPKRMAAQPVATLQQAYDAAGFNFNKAFIQKERLWEGEWYGRQLAWYYNKFPFVRYHGLLVLARQAQQPQYLTAAAHDVIWQLVTECGESFPDLGIGYNSLGAFASVNHLHFQWFLEPAGLPIMSRHWQHNGGSQPYPLSCYHETNPQQAWQRISSWHAQGVPYNLVYSPQGLYALPRQRQGDISHQDWTSGFSWIETAGHMLVQSATAFAQLSASEIEMEMAKLSLSIKELPASE